MQQKIHRFIIKSSPNMYPPMSASLVRSLSISIDSLICLISAEVIYHWRKLSAGKGSLQSLYNWISQGLLITGSVWKLLGYQDNHITCTGIHDVLQAGNWIAMAKKTQSHSARTNVHTCATPPDVPKAVVLHELMPFLTQCPPNSHADWPDWHSETVFNVHYLQCWKFMLKSPVC